MRAANREQTSTSWDRTAREGSAAMRQESNREVKFKLKGGKRMQNKQKMKKILWMLNWFTSSCLVVRLRLSHCSELTVCLSQLCSNRLVKLDLLLQVQLHDPVVVIDTIAMEVIHLRL